MISSLMNCRSLGGIVESRSITRGERCDCMIRMRNLGLLLRYSKLNSLRRRKNIKKVGQKCNFVKSTNEVSLKRLASAHRKKILKANERNYDYSDQRSLRFATHILSCYQLISIAFIYDSGTPSKLATPSCYSACSLVTNLPLILSLLLATFLRLS